MVLYHGTSQYRAKLIFESGIIKKDAPRYFTKENNGANFSSNGFVYLSNEITWAYRFAMLHGNVEEENYGYIFKIVIPDEMILADEDELGDLFPHVLQMYSNRLAELILMLICKHIKANFAEFALVLECQNCLQIMEWITIIQFHTIQKVRKTLSIALHGSNMMLY